MTNTFEAMATGYAFIEENDFSDSNKTKYVLLVLLESLKTIYEENNTLRGLLGNSSKDCPYCGLPASEQGRCSYGFPGCKRADDQLLYQGFADSYRVDVLEKQIQVMRSKIEFAVQVLESIDKDSTIDYRQMMLFNEEESHL